MENKTKGILGEKIAREDYENNGYRVISTRVGSDFVVYKKIGTKIYKEYVEVKTGRARQSLTQKRKMRELRRIGINYTIYRVTEKFLSHYTNSNGGYRKKQSKVDRLQEDEFGFDQSIVKLQQADIIRHNSTGKMYINEDILTTVMQPKKPMRRSEFILGIAPKKRKYSPKSMEATMGTLQEGRNLNV